MQDIQQNSTALETTIGGTPVILLPKFSGDYFSWTSFYQTFVALVHKNTALNNVTRFHFLRSALNEKALSCILSLEVTEANYEVALETLVSRYHKKQVIAHEHIKKIFNLPHVTRNSAIELRELLDELNVYFSTLTSIGRPTAHWDDLIIYLFC